MAGDTSNGNIDIDTVFSGDDGVTIDESERLKFAKQVLFCLFLICAGLFIGYAIFPDNTALSAMFELVKIGALPLVTLVISFYFPTSSS